MAAATVTRLADVRGHEVIKDQLRVALAQDRLGHTLLFTGPEGIGKQRLARALAALFVCEAAGDCDACGECPGCRQLAAGSHPDARVVTVPAGKREIRIEPIRELRAFLQLAPVSARRKLALVVDAHALNANAQNALLKTLEEPPPRSLLMLVTHAPGTLLPTVRSRCHRLRCAPLPDDVVVEILQREAGLPAAEAATAAAYAEGSPGLALQLRGVLGAARRTLLSQLAELPGARYVHLAQMTRDATARDDPALPLAMMLTWFRDQAVRGVGAAAIALRNADLADTLPPASPEAAVARAEAVTDALAQLRRGNPNRQLLLEALLLRLRDRR